MEYILLGKLVFKVSGEYLDEPSDNSYPLFDIITDEQIGTFTASYLQQAAIRIPSCYIDVYKDNVNKCLENTLAKIDIRPVLRLLVNNDKYIHYIVGPVLMGDLIVREGGQYFTYVNNAQGEPVLYAAETALELQECIKHEISSCVNRGVTILHDKYFEEALTKLKDYHLAGDACSVNAITSKWKEQVEQEQHEHGWHCSWCAEIGLDGTHLNNPWASDGSVYDDGSKTTKSIYIK